MNLSESIKITVLERDARSKYLCAAKLYFYENGTKQPKPTFFDEARTIEQPHPVAADSDGYFPQPHLLDGGYDVELRSHDDELMARYARREDDTFVTVFPRSEYW